MGVALNNNKKKSGTNYIFQVFVAGAAVFLKKQSPGVLFDFYVLCFNILNVEHSRQKSRHSDIRNQGRPSPGRRGGSLGWCSLTRALGSLPEASRCFGWPVPLPSSEAARLPVSSRVRLSCFPGRASASSECSNSLRHLRAAAWHCPGAPGGLPAGSRAQLWFPQRLCHLPAGPPPPGGGRSAGRVPAVALTGQPPLLCVSLVLFLSPCFLLL